MPPDGPNQTAPWHQAGSTMSDDQWSQVNESAAQTVQDDADVFLSPVTLPRCPAMPLTISSDDSRWSGISVSSSLLGGYDEPEILAPQAAKSISRVLMSAIAIIEGILAGDKGRPKKQQHTAKRIFERLRDEHGFTGGITIVKEYVAGWRQRARRCSCRWSIRQGTRRPISARRSASSAGWSARSTSSHSTCRIRMLASWQTRRAFDQRKGACRSGGTAT